MKSFLVSKCLAEALGTFCLVFAGTGAVIVNQISGGQLGVVGIGLVFGLIVLAMIYAVGPVSGAHLNPAVTLGFYISGRHAKEELAPYIVAQLLGAALASFVLRLVFSDHPTNLGITQPAASTAQSFVLEFFLTLMLMFVILNVASGDHTEGIMAGVAVGAVITLEAIFAGPICGASMNPARSWGPALATGNFKNLWLYWLAPCLGSVSATFFFQLIRPRPQRAEAPR